MLTFAGALRAVETLLQHGPADRSHEQKPLVRFDAGLTRELLAMHDALNARFSEAIGKVGHESEQACSGIRDCATDLHKLRRAEAVRLYPVIAAGIDRDAAARGQLMQLRIALLGHVKAVLRGFDELSRDIQSGVASRASAEPVAIALAAFLRRCASEIYPLYDLIGKLQPARAA